MNNNKNQQYTHLRERERERENKPRTKTKKLFNKRRELKINKYSQELNFTLIRK